MKKISTLAALLFALFSLTYAIWQKRTTDNKVRDAQIQTMLRYRRISSQDIFTSPTEESLKTITRKSCISIANQISTNSYSDNEYGNFSRECAAFILNSLAKNMSKDETLLDYFNQKKKTEK